jgi:hypothetical protein
MNRLAPRPALIGETEVAVFSEHEMIQERDPQELSALAEALGEDSILLTRRRITGRMIMGTNTSGRIHQDQRLEDFPGMDNRDGQGPDRDNIEPNDVMLCIESANKELLAIETFKTGPEESGSGRRGLDGPSRPDAGFFTDQRDTIARHPIRQQWSVRLHQPFGPRCDLSVLFFHPNSSLNDVTPPLANHGGGAHKEEDAGSGALAAGGPARAEAQREGPERHDPLLLSDGPPPLGSTSESKP